MLKRILCLMLCLLCAFSAVEFAAADTPNEIFPLSLEEIPETLSGQHHYLLACADTNWTVSASKLTNTDGILLVTLDTTAKRVMITTLTREMLIRRPDGIPGRITFIAKNYGPETLCEIVSTHFGVKVDKYVIFDMDDVQTIIDSMGGVEITVTQAEADYLNRYRIARDATTPSMANAGTYLFGGHAAVIYMRIRKVGGTGDSGRTRRIRTVLATLAEKYTEASLGDALDLLENVTGHLVTTNMTMSDMMEAVGYCMQLRGVPVEGKQMPEEEDLTPIWYSGMQTRQVNWEHTRQAMADFLAGDSFGVTED